MTLDDLFDKLAPDVARAFREAIAQIVDNVVLQQVIDAIEKNDVDAAFRAIDFDPMVFNRFYFTMNDVMQAGGTFTLSNQPKRVDGLMLRFNVRDKRAEEWLQHQSSTLITRIEAETRIAVSNTMQAGLAAGRNPRSTALDIVGRINPTTGKREGGTIGLGAREEEWARSVRQKLLTLDPSYLDNALRDARFDSVVEKAIAEGRSLPLATVDRLVDRYRVRALQHRGETIARTDTMAALQRSEWLSIQQTIEKGKLSESEVTKEWDSTSDDRVRPSHRALHGTTVGFNEPFVSPITGARMMHPGDFSLGAGGQDVIACRCKVKYKVDWLARAQAALDRGR